MSEFPSLCVVGLGYVGLPLAVAFSKIMPVKGFDVDTRRINSLRKGIDKTGEFSCDDLMSIPNLEYFCEVDSIKDCNVFIVTVPTPVDNFNTPDFGPLLSASQMIGSVMKKNSIVIYESTVYPGATEDVCVPCLEQVSGLKFNESFFCGYSPERINPGDKIHGFTSVVKVVSGSTPDTADYIEDLYKLVVTAGVHRAPSIKVAEASKVIENTQRDLNISLMNELSLIFDRIGIDTHDVLEAASTKWNFIPFKPGLVGGHCISVDPYYLSHKAIELGYYPEVILAGRRVNSKMPEFVSLKTIKEVIRRGIDISMHGVLVLGLTFKENCPDLRNSKSIELVRLIVNFGVHVDVYDPQADKEEVVAHINDVQILDAIDFSRRYSAIILAVPHREFVEISVEKLKCLLVSSGVFFDVKGVFDMSKIDFRL